MPGVRFRGMEPGTHLGPYEIVRQLGAGGMGEVWLATDTRLGRRVAIKVLPEELSSDPELLHRMQREARNLAALDHPNIVSLFSIEHEEGVDFLTMAYVDGQPLDRLLPEDGFPADAKGTPSSERRTCRGRTTFPRPAFDCPEKAIVRFSPDGISMETARMSPVGDSEGDRGDGRGRAASPAEDATENRPASSGMLRAAPP